MAKPIIVSLGGVESRFDHEKLDRTKLYGKRQRQVLDPGGSRCEKAELTRDGTLLVRTGMTAQGYFDEGGSWVPSNKLVGLGPDGKPLPMIGSTLGESQKLTGPVDATEVLDLAVRSVYALNPEGLDPKLEAELKAGKVYMPAQAERAARNFFRKGNLIALREIALRRTAEHVEDDVRSYRVEKSIAPVWNTEGALLACIGPREGAEQAVRTAARSAFAADRQCDRHCLRRWVAQIPRPRSCCLAGSGCYRITAPIDHRLRLRGRMLGACRLRHAISKQAAHHAIERLQDRRKPALRLRQRIPGQSPLSVFRAKSRY